MYGFVRDIVFLALILVILELLRQKGNKCDIPLFTWLEVFFCIFFLETTFRLRLLIMHNYSMASKIWYYYMLMFTFYLFLAVWAIYGMVLNS